MVSVLIHRKLKHAVVEIPIPKDVKSVRCLLGFTQYLSKLLPHLEDIMKPLRELTQEETTWIWDKPQQTVLDTLKQMVTNTLVLWYYSLHDKVKIQCDASQCCTPTKGTTSNVFLLCPETHYTQIEKEFLAIVYACQHYDVYTDHKQKPLFKAPSGGCCLNYSNNLESNDHTLSLSERLQ